MKCGPAEDEAPKRQRQNLWPWLPSPLLILLTLTLLLLSPLPSAASSPLPQTSPTIPSIFSSAAVRARHSAWNSHLYQGMKMKSSIPSLGNERGRIDQIEEVNGRAQNDLMTAMSSSLLTLSKTEFQKLSIVSIEDVARNVKKFRIALPTANHELGLRTSSFVQIRDPENRIRPYTPISLNRDKGFFDLAIKVYIDGAVSTYLHSLNIGDVVEVRGPFEKLLYSPNMKDQIGMIAGGTGITPMLQILREISQPNSRDRTLVKLLFANHAEADIIMKEELSALEEANPNFDIKYIVNQPSSSNWKGYTGRLNQELLHVELPSPCPGTLIYVCGPPSMMEAISGDKLPNKEQGPVRGILKDLGYDGMYSTAKTMSHSFVLSPSSLRPLRVDGVQILVSEIYCKVDS